MLVTVILIDSVVTAKSSSTARKDMVNVPSTSGVTVQACVISPWVHVYGCPLGASGGIHSMSMGASGVVVSMSLLSCALNVTGSPTFTEVSLTAKLTTAGRLLITTRTELRSTSPSSSSTLRLTKYSPSFSHCRSSRQLVETVDSTVPFSNS